MCHVVVPGKDKVDWRLAKHASRSVNGFADPPSVQVFFAVSALLCEHVNVRSEKLVRCSDRIRRCLVNRVEQKGLFSPMERLETEAKRGVSGASIQVTTVWSRCHVGDVVDIMCDLAETGVVM